MPRAAEPTRRAFLGTLAAATGGLVLSACSSSEPDGASSSSVAAASSSASSDLEVPLYWQGTNGPKSYLFREFSTLQKQSGVSAGDVVGNSISMLSRGKPLAPHYHNAWNTAERVGTSMTKDGTLVLDLPEGMFRHDLSSTEAELALQQLVYTATGAAAASGMPNAKATTPVKVLVDGDTGYQFADKTVSEKMTRDAKAQAPFWIIDPFYGAEADGDVVFKMVASHVASTVRWTITKDGSRVKHGTVDLGGKETNSQEIQFTQHLADGEYEVKIYADNDDVSDQSLVSKGTDPSLYDLHAFTVKSD